MSLPYRSPSFRLAHGLALALGLLLGAGCSTISTNRSANRPENPFPVSQVERTPSGKFGSPKLDRDTYLRALRERIGKVTEFKAIGEWAKDRGVRVWGAGGTAAGFATYVKHDLE